MNALDNLSWAIQGLGSSAQTSFGIFAGVLLFLVPGLAFALDEWLTNYGEARQKPISKLEGI